MIRIAIVIGTTRPGRRGDQVARWVHEQAQARSAGASDVVYELVDLVEVGLPMLDEPLPAAHGDPRWEYTHRWGALVAAYDGFIFVTPEYNHGMPAALKNAIDFLFVEWQDKAAAFVSYGLHGGVLAVEQLRLVLAELKVAGVRSQVALNLFNDFEITDPTRPGTFTPADRHLAVLDRMLEELVDWSTALAGLRRPELADAAAAEGRA